MKNTISAILIFIITGALVTTALVGPEKQKKPTGCPYEGLECPNAKAYVREYQLDVDQDSIYLYDGPRRVGASPVNWEHLSGVDSLIAKDNL